MQATFQLLGPPPQDRQCPDSAALCRPQLWGGGTRHHLPGAEFVERVLCWGRSGQQHSDLCDTAHRQSLLPAQAALTRSATIALPASHPSCSRNPDACPVVPASLGLRVWIAMSAPTLSSITPSQCLPCRSCCQMALPASASSPATRSGRGSSWTPLWRSCRVRAGTGSSCDMPMPALIPALPKAAWALGDKACHASPAAHPDPCPFPCRRHCGERC